MDSVESALKAIVVLLVICSGADYVWTWSRVRLPIAPVPAAGRDRTDAIAA